MTLSQAVYFPYRLDWVEEYFNIDGNVMPNMKFELETIGYFTFETSDISAIPSIVPQRVLWKFGR